MGAMEPKKEKKQKKIWYILLFRGVMATFKILDFFRFYLFNAMAIYTIYTTNILMIFKLILLRFKDFFVRLSNE